MEGLLILLDKTSDLSESCLVKILSFAIIAEHGTTPPVVNKENIPLILRILRYSYSPAILTQELKILNTDNVMILLRLVNCLFAQLLVSESDGKNVPKLDQVVDFLNCLLDASSRLLLNVPECEKEIQYSQTPN